MPDKPVILAFFKAYACKLIGGFYCNEDHYFSMRDEFSAIIILILFICMNHFHFNKINKILWLASLFTMTFFITIIMSARWSTVRLMRSLFVLFIVTRSFFIPRVWSRSGFTTVSILFFTWRTIATMAGSLSLSLRLDHYFNKSLFLNF